MCETISDELHLKGTEKLFCRQSDSCPDLGEEIHGALDPFMSKQSTLS